MGEELGRGAYGTVFLGLDTRTGEHVAIKALSFERLSADALSGVASEVELLQNLNHRNIVKYLGSFRTSSHLYIILELMENGSLSNVIKTSKFGPFPESLIPVYIHQVLQGLAYLHAQGVVHRDIKGANILTTKEGVVKLADFGVAAKIGGEIGEAALGGVGSNNNNIDDGQSRDASPQGTPYWMAPEVVEMKPVTTAADIWSVGCLAVELLTGSPPYFDLQPMSALYNIVQDKHPPIPNDISDEMRDFLLKCFQKDPAGRPSAEELLQHPWVQYNRRTLRTTWSKATTTRKKEELGSIVSVMERLLLDSNSDQNQQQKQQLGEESAPSTPIDKHGGSEEDDEDDEDEAMHEELLSTLAADPTGLGLLEHLEDHLRSGSGGLEGGGVVGGGVSLTNSSRPLSGTGTTAGDGGEGVSQSADVHRRAAAEVRRQLASLHLNVPPGERSIRAEAAAAASCRVLIKYVSTDASLRALFVAEGGVSALRELLDAPSERLLVSALDLLLVLCAEDTRAAEACCLIGLIPAALRYTAPSYPPDARLPAAQLAVLLAQKSKGTCQMLVACQGIPFVMTLLDEGQQTAYELELMQSAMSTLWAILHHSQMKGWSISANAYFRLLGHHGAPYRIAKVLPWVLKNCLAVENNNNSNSNRNSRGSSSVLQQPWQSTTTSGSSTPIGNNMSNGPRHSKSASMPQDVMKGMHPYMNGSQPSPAAISASKASVGGSRQSFMSTSLSSASKKGGGEGTIGEDLIAQRSTVSESDAQNQPPTNPPSSSSSQMPPLQALFESLLNFFCVMTLGDSSVKQKCAHADTLASIFSLSGMQQPVMLRMLTSIKRLSTDQGAWHGIEKAGGVLYLVAQLPRYSSAVVAAAAATANTTTTTTTQQQQQQVTLGLIEVLSGLQNLCQLSRVRQEQAAVAGVVAYLCTLAKIKPTTNNNTQVGPPSWQVQAVSLLGSLAHGSPRCRAELWAHGGMDTLLQLLQQPPFHLVVLDALSFWLEAEPTRVEPQLLDDTALDSLANILARGVLQYNNRDEEQQQYFLQHGGQERLQGILVALQRLLNRSQRLAVALASSALPVNVLELLKQPSAASALPLLEILKCLYENHPRPKEFILKNRVIGVLGALANGTVSSDQVLVRHQAQNLMDAFQVNMVF